MPADQKIFLWLPLLVLWFATIMAPFVPALKERFENPQVRRYALIVRWAAVAGILVVVWFL